MNSPLRRLAVVVALMFGSLLVSTTYIQFVNAGALATAPTNKRSIYRELGRQRGPILVDGREIARSVPVEDNYRYQREYPGGPKYAPITGVFSVIGESTGLESAENDLLDGSADQLFYRRISDLLTGAEPKGAAVSLTIDPRAQDAAWEGLGRQRGAVIALEPSTGNVLAMVSKPSYDPDVLAVHDSQQAQRAYRRLLQDPDDPLINRTINTLYFPGSTFKVVTSAAAIAKDDYTADTKVSGPATLRLPGTASATLSNDDFRPCSGTFAQILAVSCNTAYAQLGLDIGQDTLREQATKFGFNERLTIPLRVSASNFPAELNQPQLAQSSIGQFDVKATPLQMAMVAAGVANDGVVMEPNLIREVQTADLATVTRSRPQQLGRAVSADVAKQLTSMMELVVTSGTGSRARIPGVAVAGKTGTAQQGPDDPPHAWFMAFAPAQDPQVAVAVVVEDGGRLGNEAFGGIVAAPIARAVMEAVIER